MMSSSKRIERRECPVVVELSGCFGSRQIKKSVFHTDYTQLQPNRLAASFCERGLHPYTVDSNDTRPMGQPALAEARG